MLYRTTNTRIVQHLQIFLLWNWLLHSTSLFVNRSPKLQVWTFYQGSFPWVCCICGYHQELCFHHHIFPCESENIAVKDQQKGTNSVKWVKSYMFPSVYNFQTLFNVPVYKIKSFTCTSTLKESGLFSRLSCVCTGRFCTKYSFTLSGFALGSFALNV